MVLSSLPLPCTHGTSSKPLHSTQLQGAQDSTCLVACLVGGVGGRYADVEVKSLVCVDERKDQSLSSLQAFLRGERGREDLKGELDVFSNLATWHLRLLSFAFSISTLLSSLRSCRDTSREASSLEALLRKRLRRRGSSLGTADSSCDTFSHSVSTCRGVDHS